MKKYAIFVDGEKAVLEDIVAIADVAGKAEDGPKAQNGKVPYEQTTRKGWVVPWVEGPIVVPDGATGKVKVRQFWAYMSPVGANTNPGTDYASGGSSGIEDLVSCYYAGESISIPTPLPTATNGRWDLLYAIVGEADSDAANRLVKNASTKISAITSMFTRHKATVTLAWVQGTVSPLATDPYPYASVPVLPTPASGQAHIPLAYVRVQYNATPGTVSYIYDDIANAPRIAHINTQGRLTASGSGNTAGAKTALQTALKVCPARVISTTAAQGGWPITGANKKPVGFLEPMAGGHVKWIHIGPFSTTAANKTFVAAWTVLSEPIFTPDLTDPLGDNSFIDWRNRWFFGTIAFGRTTVKAAHDVTADYSTGWTPTAYGAGALFGSGDYREISCGHSFRTVNSFDTEHALGTHLWAPVCIWRDIGKTPANDDLALVVNMTTGALHLAGREATSNVLNSYTGVIKLEASPVPFPYEFTT